MPKKKNAKNKIFIIFALGLHRIETDQFTIIAGPSTLRSAGWRRSPPAGESKAGRKAKTGNFDQITC